MHTHPELHIGESTAEAEEEVAPGAGLVRTRNGHDDRVLVVDEPAVLVVAQRISGRGHLPYKMQSVCDQRVTAGRQAVCAETLLALWAPRGGGCVSRPIAP